MRSHVQKTYWGVLSGITPVTEQIHKLTYSELQLVSQQIPQRALDLGWPLRSIPNEGRELGSYTPTWAQGPFLATVIP